MTEGDILVKALADVRQRRIELQADYDRIGEELSKLKLAEKALAAIVEGATLDSVALSSATLAADGQIARPAGRGSRGPRANSAKGRLKTLLQEAGQKGLTSAEISQRLPDVAIGTLNSYLSLMVSGGEAVRSGDFFASGNVSIDSHLTGGDQVGYAGGLNDEIGQDVSERDETAETDAIATITA